MAANEDELYKVTYANGEVHYCNYRQLVNRLGHQSWYRKIIAVGAATMPAHFTDVTADFPKAGPRG